MDWINITVNWITCFYEIWWRHEMENLSELLVLCEGNAPTRRSVVSHKRPIIWIFDFYSLLVRTIGWRSGIVGALQWRHNDHDGVSNHQPHGCLLNRLFRRRSKKTSKLRVTGLCVGNSPGPVNSSHKGPVTPKMFPFDDVIMWLRRLKPNVLSLSRNSCLLGCVHHRTKTKPNWNFNSLEDARFVNSSRSSRGFRNQRNML